MNDTNLRKYRNAVDALIAGAQALGVSNAGNLLADGVVGDELRKALAELRKQGRTDDNAAMMKKIKAACRDVGETFANHRLFAGYLGDATEKFVNWLGEKAAVEAADDEGSEEGAG